MLLAPDVPTWYFRDAAADALSKDVRLLHCFHPRDEAVEISRQRRGLEFPVPGNGPVLAGVPGVTTLDCAQAAASMGSHDYGRTDFRCVAAQAAFLDGGRVEDLEGVEPGEEDHVWALVAG